MNPAAGSVAAPPLRGAGEGEVAEHEGGTAVRLGGVEGVQARDYGVVVFVPRDYDGGDVVDGGAFHGAEERHAVGRAGTAVAGGGATGAHGVNPIERTDCARVSQVHVVVS